MKTLVGSWFLRGCRGWWKLIWYGKICVLLDIWKDICLFISIYDTLTGTLKFEWYLRIAFIIRIIFTGDSLARVFINFLERSFLFFCSSFDEIKINKKNVYPCLNYTISVESFLSVDGNPSIYERVPIHRTLRTGHTGHFAEKTTKVHRTVVSQGYLPN